jgi:hypothetical protein
MMSTAPPNRTTYLAGHQACVTEAGRLSTITIDITMFTFIPIVWVGDSDRAD